MALIDEPRAQSIYAAMGKAVEKSGGSAANTIVGVAGFGARAAFVGKVKDDKLGQSFATTSARRASPSTRQPAKDGPSTACCYVMVTPDGERTMNTYLGAAQNLYPDDVDADAIAASAITYLEGYLWDPPHAKEAFRKAAKIAHGAGRKVALTLSDAFCVGRYRAEFLDLIKTGTVDLVFANESELKSLYETADFDTAVKALRGDAKLAVVTRSEKGCVVVSKDDDDRGAGGADRQARRRHRRGRSVRGGLPVRAGARPRSQDRGAAWRARGGRGDPAHRRAARGVAEGARAEGRSAGLTADRLTVW